MKASSFEFRFRVVIVTLFYLLGFWAPWEHYLGSSGAAITTTWLELAGAMASAHWLSLNGATLLITALSLAALAAGAFLRIWGTAYLGASTVHASQMHASLVVAAGPYRYTRNPLYLGSLLASAGMSILMPPTGAAFFLLLLTFFFLRLILAEESMLSAQQGSAYHAYKEKVPRIVPAWSPRVPASTAQPHWIQSILVESFYPGIALCFAVLAWRYNSWLLTKCVLICFGASLVLRALVSGNRNETVSSHE